MEALYGLAYAAKFKVKKGSMQIDYGVMPLEGQWWTDDMNDFSVDRKDWWKWTMAIMQPDYITDELVKECMFDTSGKKDLPALSHIYFSKRRDGWRFSGMHFIIWEGIPFRH